MSLRHPLVPAVLLAFSCALFSSPAKADTFAFTFSTPGTQNALNATGTFITAADPTNPGVQDIISLTGTLTNGALTGDNSPVGISLIPVQQGQTAQNPSVKTFDAGLDPTDNQESYFYLTYDNFLYATGPLFDTNGLAFISTDGISYELGADGNGYAYEAFNNNENFDQRTLDFNAPALTLTITDETPTSVTPEPTSLALLGTGLLGLIAVDRKRLPS